MRFYECADAGSESAIPIRQFSIGTMSNDMRVGKFESSKNDYTVHTRVCEDNERMFLRNVQNDVTSDGLDGLAERIL